jgi:hypothetical protein
MKLKLFLFFLACFSLNTNAQLLWKITGKDLRLLHTLWELII